MKDINRSGVSTVGRDVKNPDLFEDFNMDQPSQAGPSGSEDALRLSHEDWCPECEERSRLRALVCDLLYRNQTLRFDLMSAREQLFARQSPTLFESSRK
jgi:hypothetical protein